MDWKLDLDLDALGLPPDQQLLDAAREMGEAQIANIQIRLTKGIGLDDAPMAPYSPAYAKKRERIGMESQIRTLNFTGSMQRSLSIRSAQKIGSEIVVEVGFANPSDQEKAAYNQQRTPWFGVSPQDEAALRRVVELRLAEIFGRS